MPLLRAAGAHERAYATALTIAREQAIARSVEAEAGRRDAAEVSAQALLWRWPRSNGCSRGPTGALGGA